MNGSALIEARGLSKAYAGNLVLQDVDFTARAGEVHCIVGENGAGKSTLIKLLAGAVAPTAGEIFFDGEPVPRLDPRQSAALGIQVIYQENILANSMSIAENIYTGREPKTPGGWYDGGAAVRSAGALILEYGLALDPEAIVGRLSAAERQFVKILKAMAKDSRALIMDEPTSMFSSRDSQKVLDIVLKIRDKGVAVVYISHHLQEIAQIADRVTVLRDGRKVSEYARDGGGFDLGRMTQDMVGRPVDKFYVKEPHAKGDVAVRVRGLRLHRDSPEISFDIRRGEILGVAGMVGSGRTEMARAIFGADRRYSGGVEVLGRQADLSSPRRSIRSDLAFVSEDRQRQGLALDMSVLENLLQVSMNKTPGLLFSRKKSWKLARPRFEQVGVRGCGPLTPARQLSGGNQQKVVLGKWLMVDSQFMIFDEPTRGIDVNAKSEIYGIIVGLAKAGKSILMISSDMPELIALSDRILVMRKGRVTGEIQGEDISEQEIIKKALEVEV